MSGIIVPIKKQLEIIDKLITQAEKDTKNNHLGTLVIARKGTKTEWYISRNNESRRYLPKKEELLARSLAQTAYAKEFLHRAEAMRTELEQLDRAGLSRSAGIMYQALAELYEKLIEPRRLLIEPYVLPKDEYVKQWQQVEYLGKPFAEGVPVIMTERGERVRSKSEKMIADKLFLMGIPYRYEYPHMFRGIGTIHIDFTLLDSTERVDIIYEHFGRMHEADYCKKTLWKIDQYEKNGYYLGRQFLCTFESTDHMLDMNHFERMIHERFQCS